MFFPFERAAEVLHAWPALLPTLPDEMMTWASLLHFPDAPDVPEPVRGGSFTVVYGAFLGERGRGPRAAAPVRELGPAMDTFAMVPPAALGDMAMDPPEPLPFVTTTALLTDLPGVGVDELVFAVGPDSGTNLALVELRQLGGAFGRRDAGRRCTGDAAGRAQPDRARGSGGRRIRGDGEGIPRVPRSGRPPYRVGDYANFVEEPTDTSRFFDADTWARLRRAKALYDPSDLFRGNHHIPPAE